MRTKRFIVLFALALLLINLTGCASEVAYADVSVDDSLEEGKIIESMPVDNSTEVAAVVDPFDENLQCDNIEGSIGTGCYLFGNIENKYHSVVAYEYKVVDINTYGPNNKLLSAVKEESGYTITNNRNYAVFTISNSADSWGIVTFEVSGIPRSVSRGTIIEFVFKTVTDNQKINEIYYFYSVDLNEFVKNKWGAETKSVIKIDMNGSTPEINVPKYNHCVNEAIPNSVELITIESENYYERYYRRDGHCPILYR